MSRTGAGSRIGVFTDEYCHLLIASPVRTIGSVPFDENIPEGAIPKEPLGAAMMTFYNGTIAPGNSRVGGQTLANYLLQLNLALAQYVPDQTRRDCRLGDFTAADYERVLAMRAEALTRGHETAELSADAAKTNYWGQSRQLLFGKVVSDIFAANMPADTPSLHVLCGIFCSPCGGIIGPDTHNWWVEHIGRLRYSQRVLNYHAVCHDASGYCRNALDLGVGYTYIPSSSCHCLWLLVLGPLFTCTLSPSKSSWAGGFDGCGYWRHVFGE